MNGSDITWFRQHMIAQRFAALEATDEKRFLGLLESNPICRGFWEMFLDQDQFRGAGEHLPSVIVENWALAHRYLQGGERQLLREHLHHCEECCAQLEAMGWAPSMSIEPEELPVRSFADEVVEHAAWLADKFAAGGQAMVRRLQDLIPAGFSLQPLLVPVALTRGPESEEQLQVIDPEAPLVNLLLAPVFWEDRTRLTIRILAAGELLHELDAQPSSPPQDFLILTYLNSPPLKAGPYTFELIPWRDGQPQPREMETRILRIEHRS